MTVRIKNWAQFQHFKDRRPPWVKLYRDLLDDMEWHELEPKAAKALVMCWLIASESDGVLPDSKKLAFRLRMTEKECLDVISKLSHWLEQDDISAISTRYQVAPVADVSDHQETETETETETEKPASRAFVLPDWVPAEAWAGYIEMRSKKKGGAMTNRARNLKIAELLKFKNAGHDVGAILDKSTANNWTDVYEPKGGAPTNHAKQESFV